MSDTVTLALIASIGPTIISTLNIWVTYMGQRDIKAKVEKVEKATNGRTAALIEATAKASHAEGMISERMRASAVIEANGVGQPTTPKVG
jgi:hypothetical protein